MVYSDALQTERSSACRVLETCRGSTVVMLLMYRRKSVGEMTPPCGTPSRIFTLLLRWPSSFTLADLSCRKHRIHLYIFPEMPLSSIFSRRPSRQTLSKAFVRSKKTETTFFFSWKAFSISWAMRASWSSVLLCFRYPVCVGDSIFRSSKKDINLLLITRSRTFPRQLRRLMGR